MVAYKLRQLKEIFLLLPEDPGYAEAATTQTRYNQSHGSSTERGIIRDPALRQSGRLQLQIKLLERLSETELSATDLEIYKICKEDFSEFEEANAKSQNSGKDEGSAEIDVIDRDISRAKDLIEKVEDKIAAVKKQEDGEEGWIHLRGRL
ncbi:hypothetical protein ACLMJK_007700 [Lecanora helva]